MFSVPGYGLVTSSCAIDGGHCVPLCMVSWRGFINLNRMGERTDLTEGGGEGFSLVNRPRKMQHVCIMGGYNALLIYSHRIKSSKLVTNGYFEQGKQCFQRWNRCVRFKVVKFDSLGLETC